MHRKHWRVSPIIIKSCSNRYDFITAWCLISQSSNATLYFSNNNSPWLCPDWLLEVKYFTRSPLIIFSGNPQAMLTYFRDPICCYWLPQPVVLKYTALLLGKSSISILIQPLWAAVVSSNVSIGLFYSTNFMGPEINILECGYILKIEKIGNDLVRLLIKFYFWSTY